VRHKDDSRRLDEEPAVISNCTARVGQRSNWKAALELHGSGRAALKLLSSCQSATAPGRAALELHRQHSNCKGSSRTADGGAHGSAPRGCTCRVAPASENRRRMGSVPDLSNVFMNTGFMFRPCCATNVSYHCVLYVTRTGMKGESKSVSVSTID